MQKMAQSKSSHVVSDRLSSAVHFHARHKWNGNFKRHRSAHQYSQNEIWKHTCSVPRFNATNFNERHYAYERPKH